MFTFFKKHKIVSVLILIVLVVGGYFGYKKINGNKTETRYVLEAVQKGSIITTVSGSGQISASNQVEVKPKVSGEILKIAVKEGQEVKAGDLLAQLDTKDAQKSLRDAQVSLQTAELSLEKIKKPATEYSVLQAENSLTNAKDSLEKLKITQVTNYDKAKNSQQSAEDDLTKAYEDAYNAVANTFLNLPTIITKLNDILYSNEIGSSESSIGKSQWNVSALMNSTHADDQLGLLNFQNNAESDYKTARNKYDANFSHYNGSSRYSDRTTIESILNETLETAKSIAQAAKSQSNYLDAWADYRSKRDQTSFSKVRDYQSSLSTYIGQTNSNLSSLLSIQRTIKDNKEAITNAINDLKEMDRNNPLDLKASEATVKERESSLAQLKAGTDDLDIKSQELSIMQRRNAVTDARQQLADYAVKIPFDGKIAKLSLTQGDSASSGSAIATLVTTQMVAEISLNEVDAAKVSVGQKATLTFDALGDLDITGQVGEVDALGTVSQGVVTYTIKITLDIQDERIKSGMSVSANIITEAKQDILIIPSSAIKSSGNDSYVEMPNEEIDSSLIPTSSNGILLKNAPRRQTIEVGITDNAYTEVVSGLTEGNNIITSTVVVSSSASSQSQAKSLLQLGGSMGGRTGGTNVRTNTNSTRSSGNSSSGGSQSGPPPGM